MTELGNVKAEKQALEQQISDLFALKAKHAPGSSRKNVSRSPVPYHENHNSEKGELILPDEESRTNTASGWAIVPSRCTPTFTRGS